MNYKYICETLKSAGIEDYAYEASLLICHFCSVSKEALFFERECEFESSELENAVRLRASRYPLQYIIGEWTFCNETYKVGKGCLIPRPETEELVMKGVALLPKDAFFLDLCTGSGCIAISTLAKRQDLRAVGVDISPDALSYAKQNAELNGVSPRVRFEKCDLLESNAAQKLLDGKKVHAILSNPPYIPSDIVPTLEAELSAEPQNALDGGEDGLVFYRKIISNFKDSLEDMGFFLFEIGYDQGISITELANAQGLECSVTKDISGNDRIAYITKNNK